MTAQPTDITEEEIDGLMSFFGDLGCNDNSCLFTRQKGGQKTNGGCRCLMDTTHSIRRFIQRSRIILPPLLQAYKKKKEDIEKIALIVMEQDKTLVEYGNEQERLEKELAQKDKVIELMKEALARDAPYDITRDKADNCLSEVKKMEGEG